MKMAVSGNSRPSAKTMLTASIMTVNGGLVAIIVVLLVIFSLFIGERFMSVSTIAAFGFQLPELAILSLAMMVAMISGGLNLSVVSTANLCALTVGYLLLHLPDGQTGITWGLAIAASLAGGFVVAAVIGIATGIIIAYFGVSPILATLGTMTLLEGIAIGLSGGNILAGFPPAIVFIGNGTVFGIPCATLVMVACLIPVSVMLQRSPIGMSIKMIGSNERATHFSGIDTRKVILKTYVISSLIACVAGIVMMARFNSASASYGESYLLVTILACVLGGIDPYGGVGRASGLILALIVLQLISSAFNLLGFSPFLALATWGMILLMTAAIAAWIRPRAM
jgi:simple sugar transport system permease protein/ribose transport system permease protein